MKFRHIILWIIFIASLVLPRYDRIERPITVDELTWLTFSADFYYGLGQGEFERTYQDHHPGVTTMWAGTSAYLIEYRAYRGQGQGYMENDTFKLIDFLEHEGVEMFDVLVTARQIMATACIIGLLIGAIYLWRLLDPFPAFIVMMFIALDPFVIGQTRLYSHEGLMSVLIFVSWLSFFDYFRSGRRWSSLLISGIAAGLATLTKITALGLVPLVGLFWLVELIRTRPRKVSKAFPSHLWRYVWPLLIWVLLLVVVFIAVWPAAWSNPVQTVVGMIEHTRGFGGSTDTNWELVWRNLTDYPASLWSHPTLITWAGILFFLISLAFPKHFRPDQEAAEVSVYTFFYAVVVYLTISILVTNIQGTRYLTSLHLFLALTAGLGFAFLFEWLRSFKFFKKQTWVLVILVFALMAGQVYTFLPAAPYYYTYNHPLRVNTWWDAHGAFLDQAGDYLAAKPDAEDLTVMTFSPGSLMFFFPGETELIFPIGSWKARDVERLERSDYLVIDYILRNLREPPRVIADLDAADVTPEHTISFQGRTFVQIYRTSDLPPEAFIPDSED